MGPQAVLDDFLFPSATHATLTLEMLGAMRGDMANNPSMMDPLSSLTAALQPCSLAALQAMIITKAFSMA
jgi:hypothetical protein